MESDDEFLVQGGGVSLYFTADHTTCYRVPIMLGLHPETGTRRVWIDPTEEHRDMWPTWRTAPDGPYVLYKVDRAYYETPGTIDCN